MCTCAHVCMYALRIVSMNKILQFINTLIINYLLILSEGLLSSVWQIPSKDKSLVLKTSGLTPKSVASRTCISTCSYLGLQKTSHPNHTHTSNPKAVSFGLLLTLTAGLQRSFDICLVVAGVPGLPIKGNAGVRHQ